jgi:chromosome segregation protein
LKLIKIEIIGFKSFADKIKLEFHEGITGIVGPNGCGKSNIADAFRWVLGEQSAKSLRGGKMLDVIFAGTATRKPLNYAEVTITLGEINGALQVEYEEVAITRRLHRNGESDYFLNRQPIRLKDLQALFLDSGIGKDAYSIFEQGKIDLIINYTPLERRSVFEEAAGILRFLQRKREALRKLEQSDLNISRVKDIHHEIEQRIIVLREQAEKARLYKENKGELEKLEKGVLVVKWDHLQKRLHETEKKGHDQKHHIEELNKQQTEIKKEGLDVKASLEIAEKKLRHKSEEVYKTRSAKEIKTRERQSNQERLKEIVVKEKHWQIELERMLEKRKGRQLERLQHHKHQVTFEAEIVSQEAMAKSQREKAFNLDVEVGKLRDKQQGLQRDHLRLIQIENQLEIEQKQTGVKLENMQERFAEMTKKREKLTLFGEELVHKIAGKQTQVDEFSEAIEIQKSLFEEKELTLNRLNEEIQQRQDEIDKVRREITGHEARHKVLLRLKQDMEGFSTGTKRLLAESANSKSPLCKKLSSLYEHLSPRKGYELALSAVMKPYTQTLIVQTQEDFEAVTAYAKTHKIKDFSLLCLAHLPLEKFPAEAGSLLNGIVDSPLSYHFFKSVFVMEKYLAGIQMIKESPGREVWIEDEGLVDRHQVAYYPTQGEGNVFMREAEIKELETKLAQLEKARTEIEGNLKQAHQKKLQAHAERTELDKTIRKQEMTLIELNFSLQRLKGDLENANRDAVQLEKDFEVINAAKLKLTATVHDLQQRHAEAKVKAEDAISKTEGLSGELENKNAQLKIEQRVLQEKEAALHRVVDENRKVLHLLHVLEVKDTESQQQEKRLEEEIQQSMELKEQMSLKGTHDEHMIQETDKLLIEVSTACQEQEKEVASIKLAIEKIENRIQEGIAKLKKQEGEAYHTGTQRTQIESACQTLESEMRERYHAGISEMRALKIVLETSVEQTERQIRILRQELEAAGDVNMMSIAEYEKHTERYDFLNRELEDMNLSKQELVAIIAQLDEESRKQFKKTFEEIRANFKKNFSILFNGGEADLHFTETSDVLEAGVEIIAKPPGKHMRSINLLSGGEKCMTAMALLFAIFEVKPSPFCILDEIDAPLDDSNIERFVNMLKQFIGRCQFIIITHNKRTMSIADLLFGVSMEEKGVSKILSMNFINSEEKKTQSLALVD